MQLFLSEHIFTSCSSAAAVTYHIYFSPFKYLLYFFALVLCVCVPGLNDFIQIQIQSQPTDPDLIISTLHPPVLHYLNSFLTPKKHHKTRQFSLPIPCSKSSTLSSLTISIYSTPYSQPCPTLLCIPHPFSSSSTRIPPSPSFFQFTDCNLIIIENMPSNLGHQQFQLILTSLFYYITLPNFQPAFTNSIYIVSEYFGCNVSLISLLSMINSPENSLIKGVIMIDPWTKPLLQLPEPFNYVYSASLIENLFKYYFKCPILKKFSNSPVIDSFKIPISKLKTIDIILLSHNNCKIIQNFYENINQSPDVWVKYAQNIDLVKEILRDRNQ
ncbi:hypothetical protein P9112_000846 [Eukaryota sp. TZLM1-RC]